MIVAVPAVPARDEARRLRGALERLPGLNTVILRTPAGDITVPVTCGLTPAHQADVAYLLGGAQVTYDTASVDYAAITGGLV